MKVGKFMKPRTENVSRLIEVFDKLSSSQWRYLMNDDAIK